MRWLAVVLHECRFPPLLPLGMMYECLPNTRFVIFSPDLLYPAPRVYALQVANTSVVSSEEEGEELRLRGVGGGFHGGDDGMLLDGIAATLLIPLR